MTIGIDWPNTGELDSSVIDFFLTWFSIMGCIRACVFGMGNLVT